MIYKFFIFSTTVSCLIETKLWHNDDIFLNNAFITSQKCIMQIKSIVQQLKLSNYLFLYL